MCFEPQAKPNLSPVTRTTNTVFGFKFQSLIHVQHCLEGLTVLTLLVQMGCTLEVFSAHSEIPINLTFNLSCQWVWLAGCIHLHKSGAPMLWGAYRCKGQLPCEKHWNNPGHGVLADEFFGRLTIDLFPKMLTRNPFAYSHCHCFG